MRARVQTVLDNYARTQLDLYRPSFRFFKQAPSRLHTAPSVSRDFFRCRGVLLPIPSGFLQEIRSSNRRTSCSSDF